MVPPASDATSLDPEEAGRREFTKVRKGFDPVEVRAHLLSLAGEVKRLRTVEAELRRKVEGLEATIAEHSSLEPSAVTRALGDEAVRVLDAVHEAAAGIRAKAEENASRMVADAHERANRLTQEATDLRDLAVRDAEELTAAARAQADEVLDEARAEAERLREAAKEEADALRTAAGTVLEERTAEAEAAATALREEAESEAARVRADATEAAESEVAEARETGREMVQEARDARERILRDLAERRQVARRQLEALRAGREALLEAFASARSVLDDATDDLVDALPAARVAADEAARRVQEDLDDAVDELDREVSEDGRGRLDPARLLDVPEELGTTTADADAAGDDASADSDTAAVPLVGSDDDDGEAAAVTDEGDDGAPAVVTSLAAAAEARAAHLRLVASSDAAPALDDDIDDDLDDDLDDEDDDDEDDGSGDEDDDREPAQVEEIFARLRADAGGQADAEVDDETGGDTVRSEAEAHGAVEAESVEPDEAEDVEQRAADQDVLDLRDAAVGELERSVARRMKRLVSDEENGVLDRVRRQKKARSAADLLDPDDDRGATFVDALVSELSEVVEAGRSFAEAATDDTRPVDASAVAASLAPRIEEWVTGPLHARLERLVDEADLAGDRTELADRLRAAYREWRNDKLEELAGDLVTLAFNEAVLAAVPASGSCRWVVDHGGLPCPDAEDNHLAGAVVCGQAYPTGDVRPPAHPGCRCQLAPTPR